MNTGHTHMSGITTISMIYFFMNITKLLKTIVATPTISEHMKKRIMLFGVSLIVVVCFIIPTYLLGAEPKPGDVINSRNIDQYTDYFPDFMVRFIRDGWGLEKPVVIHVQKREEVPWTLAFLKATKKNATTTKLTEDGLLEGFDGIGVPFLEPKEPNKALKIMWNQFYKELPDDWSVPERYLAFSRRKGGNVTKSESISHALKYYGRFSISPMPELNNPKGIWFASILDSRTPPNKDMATLTWRYKDPMKYDDMWTYVPTLRRTLRLVSSERANPIRGTPYTWDDAGGFDGKVPLFTYKYLGDQKVLALMNQKITAEEIGPNYKFHPVLHQGEAYELVDCYVIEIRSKDPRYPTSRKPVWVAKDRFGITYSEIFDRKGSFWKGYYNCMQKRMLKTGRSEEELYSIVSGSGMTDFKTEYWTATITGNLEMNTGLTPERFSPGTLGTF